MPTSFHAEFVRAFREDWGWYVILSAEKDLTSERYVCLQRKHKYSLPEKIFGWSKVYIECFGQGWSWYGHILSFTLHRDRVRIELDAKAAREMEDDGKIEATFNLNNERYAELQDALNQVFDSYDFYKVAA